MVSGRVGLLLRGVADTTEVTYAFGNSHEGVTHVFLVFQTYATCVVVLAKKFYKQGEIDASTANFYTLVCLGGSCDIFHVYVEDAGVVTAEVGKGVAAVAQVVTDVQAHAHARIAVFDIVPDASLAFLLNTIV